MEWGTRQYILLGAGVGLAAVLLRYRSLTAPAAIAAGYVVNTFERGARLTHTAQDAYGVVQDDPEALRTAAEAVVGRPVTLDAYALARMGRTEGVDGMEYRMHVALNDLDDLQRTYGTRVYSSLAALMLHSKQEIADGRFSAQNLGKRYATGREDPYEGDLLLAEKTIADHAAGVDPTGGAIKFVDKDSFGVQPGTGSYAAKVAEWAADGLEPATLDGASDNFVVFRRTA